MKTRRLTYTAMGNLTLHVNYFWEDDDPVIDSITDEHGVELETDDVAIRNNRGVFDALDNLIIQEIRDNG